MKSYWTAKTADRSFSELDGDLIKDLVGLESFTYHCGEKEYTLNYNTGEFTCDGKSLGTVEVDGKEDKQKSEFYFIVRKRSSLPHLIHIGYIKNKKKDYFVIDRAGFYVSHETD